ncbi:MAG: FGGY-family carbohydrate kinase [Bacillota bacterium]|nr:FGGY-family carbohydrate kinase [Bacillota bacterium]
MSRKEAYVGIDIGTSSVKAGLLARDLYQVVTRPSGLATSPIGAAEQDARQLWAAVVEAVREVVRGAGDVHVRAVGLSGHSPSLVAATPSGYPVTPVITWMDRRPLLEGRRSLANLENSTDGRDGGPSFEATAKWIANHHVLQAGCVCTLLQPKDFIVLRLTGRACIDSSSASCLRWYDGAKGWDARGDRDIAAFLPSIVHPWEACGTVTAEAAHETGLPAGTPVASGGIDAVVEALGAGILEPGVACDATGTSTCVSLVRPTEGDGGCVRHVAPGRFLSVAPVSYTGGSLKWALSVLFPGEAEAVCDWRGLVAQAVEASTPGASGLVFIPHMVGQRSPRVNPHAQGAFVGLGPRHTRADMLRAVLEGCSYAVRESLEAVCPDHAVEEVRAVGSGAKHGPWLQIKADVLGVPYARMAVTEGAVLGAIILAGYCCGDFASVEEATGRLVRRRRVFEPHDDARRVYEVMYEAYREASLGLRRADEVLAGLRREDARRSGAQAHARTRDTEDGACQEISS